MYSNISQVVKYDDAKYNTEEGIIRLNLCKLTRIYIQLSPSSNAAIGGTPELKTIGQMESCQGEKNWVNFSLQNKEKCDTVLIPGSQIP